MKDTCLLHVGMPKTGSSTLQLNLSTSIYDPRAKYGKIPENMPFLKDHGGMIFTAFCDSPENYHFVSGHGIKDIPQFISKVKQSLEEGFCDKLGSIEIISGEDLFHLSESTRCAERLQIYLSKFFKEIKLFAYVRGPASFLPSAFQQLVKYHGLSTLETDLLAIKYANLMRYRDVFGSENVQMRHFLPSRFVDNDIMIDFTTSNGLRPQKSMASPVNIGLSTEVTSILFTYNNWCGELGLKPTGSGPLYFKLESLLKGFGRTKLRFTDSLVKRILEPCYADYEWITSIMGEDLNKDWLSPSDGDIDSEKDLIDCACMFAPELSKIFGLNQHKCWDDPVSVAKLVGSIIRRIDQ